MLPPNSIGYPGQDIEILFFLKNTAIIQVQ